MATGDIKIAYATNQVVSITLASLATDATQLVGVESNSIDNRTNKYADYELSGQIMTGTTPTVSKEIRVYVVAIFGDDATWPDVFDGTGSAETITNTGIRDSICKLAAVMVNTATSNVAYPFCVSVASLFGGICPSQFVVFVTHNTAVNLNSTGGNHFINARGIYSTVA